VTSTGLNYCASVAGDLQKSPFSLSLADAATGTAFCTRAPPVRRSFAEAGIDRFCRPTVSGNPGDTSESITQGSRARRAGWVVLMTPPTRSPEASANPEALSSPRYGP
jgi:hypothetical protein